MADRSHDQPRPKRARHLFILDAGLLERARNAASFLAGSPEFLTLGGLVDAALARELARLEKKHNRGKPFPKRPRPLQGGRRPG